MALHRIEHILKESMGLNAASIGSSAIQRAVNQRMASLQLTDIDNYVAKLERNRTELAELIEMVVIPETWFFRDMAPFSTLVDALQKTGKSRAPLNILSVPCSTGEEPYTIAMALDEAGVNLDNVRIDAVDISSRNIALAQRAQYSNNSFRSSNLEFRDRYFQQTRHGYHLKPEIKRCVNFTQDNILDAAFGSQRPMFDAIFCRNLLIYFDRATQARAIDVLSTLLKDDGLLFLGHAEAGVLTGRAFESLPYERCFGFRRALPADDSERITSKPRSKTPPAKPARQRAETKPKNTTGADFFAKAARAPAPVQDEPLVQVDTALNPIIVEAERLANEGHLVEAANLCASFLAKTGPDASAYYLLGLIREATGESDDAIEYLRKAIYLDPRHTEAMAHLALILSRMGETAEAARIQARADRIHQRQAGES